MNRSIHHQLEEIVGFGSAGPTKTVFYESEKLKETKLRSIEAETRMTVLAVQVK